MTVTERIVAVVPDRTIVDRDTLLDLAELCERRSNISLRDLLLEVAGKVDRDGHTAYGPPPSNGSFARGLMIYRKRKGI